MSAALTDIQRKFQDRLLTGSADIDPHLGTGGPFMKVYDHAYHARLIEILAEDFEGLHTLLGDEQFDAAMLGYVDAHPPTARSVRWVGRHLADWLAETDPWSNTPMIADMARFEWLLGLAFDAPDDESLSLDAMANVPPEAWPMLTFTFHHALHTVELTTDVVPFQRAVADGVDPDAAPAPFEAPVTWAAWRDPETMMVMHRMLEADEAAALRAAKSGETFDALCEVVADLSDTDDAAMRAASILRSWLENGWIVGLDAEGMSF